MVTENMSENEPNASLKRFKTQVLNATGTRWLYYTWRFASVSPHVRREFFYISHYALGANVYVASLHWVKTQEKLPSTSETMHSVIRPLDR